MLNMRWLIVVLAFGIGSVHSQDKSPADNVLKNKSHTSKSEKKANPDKQGTAKNPLVIKRLDAEETTERREQMRAEREEKAANEHRLILWTIVLAVATILLAMVAAGQLVMFWIQLQLMRKATEDAGEAADAAKTSADAAKETATITTHAFYRAHRPKLIIRWIYLIDEKTVQFEVTNIGENDAEILGAHVEVCMDNLPAKSPYTAEGDARGLFPKFIHFGQAHEVKWQVLDDKTSERFHLELGWNSAMANGRHADEAKKIYLLGYVTYQDERMHIRHRTAFCRLYDYRKRRFLPMPDADPDYEHAD